MKDDLKIILFLCNWCPHAAFQTLQDTFAPLPREIRMIRIPCSGRITKSLLFKAFETGADGVALLGCEPGTCRYGIGTRVAERNVEDTRGILRLWVWERNGSALPPSIPISLQSCSIF